MGLRERLIREGLITPADDDSTEKEDKQMKFHNPYHFVPVKRPSPNHWLKLDNQERHSREAFNRRLPKRCRHDRYLSEEHRKTFYHGRIICRLETRTPVFVGGNVIRGASREQAAKIAHFKLDGRPAIPASTLRGMISSVAEAASNSSLRVLEDRPLTRRSDVKAGEALSAIGMIVEKRDGKLGLLPLTLPVLKVTKTEEKDIFKLSSESRKWRRVFKKYPVYGQYVQGYKPKNRKSHELERISFLASKDPESWSSAHQKPWFAKFSNNMNITWEGEDRVKIPNPKNRGSFIIGQKTACLQSLAEKKQDGHIRGIMRVLGIEGRQMDIIGGYNRYGRQYGKKHEIFIPFPDDNSCRNDVLDLGNALDSFHDMADERADNKGQYPFELKGMERIWIGEKNTVRLREKDLVFFDVEEKDDKIEVSRISLSAIWRRDCGGKVHDYFKDIDKELLPFSPEREKLSPAELLFGFVEDWEGHEKDNNQEALSYKGRVRFSHGLLDKNNNPDKLRLDYVILKILDSPKPPCPCLYFRNKDGSCSFIGKAALNKRDHEPQGRKFYLHHNVEEEMRRGKDLYPWQTHPNLTKKGDKDSRLQQKAEIRPVNQGVTFWFHVDFENLNEYELGMLLFALEPDKKFHHKIGMGKPLGLGTVKVEPVGLLLMDRQKRYKECHDPLKQSRYPEALCDSTEKPAMPEHYLKDFNKESQNSFKFKEQIKNLRKTFEDDQKEKDINTSLKLLGDPSRIKWSVHTPLCSYQENELEEMETFRWFTENEKRPPYRCGKQQLCPIAGNNMPYLKKIDHCQRKKQ